MNKYKAIRTEHNGRMFASKGEARRAAELELLQRAGQIKNLAYQVKFPLVIGKVKICDYVCDFQYYEPGAFVVEDFKGMRPPVYRLKAKLMLAIHGIQIRETGNAKKR